MDPHTLVIPLGFILLAAVLCLLLIDSRYGWKRKLALIIIVPAFGLGVWASLSSYKGWPTTTEPPKKALVFWTLIREPDPEHGDKGAIFIWAMPYQEQKAKSLNPLDYDTPGGEPRAYKLPYSRQLHAGLDQAKASMGQGQPVVLEFGEEQPSGENGDPAEGTDEESDGDQESGASRRHPNGSPGEENSRAFRLYQLPPPQPPVKRPEQ